MRSLRTGILQQERNMIKKQYALSFDGVNDYISLLPITGGDSFKLEIEFSFKTISDQWVINQRSGIYPDIKSDWQLVYHGVSFVFWVFKDTNTAFNLPTPTVNTYNSYVFDYDKLLKILKIYINGNLYTTKSNIEIHNIASSTVIGKAGWANAYFFGGNIRKLKVESTNNYEADFTTGQGNQLIDKSGNNNHGTIYGAQWVEI